MNRPAPSRRRKDEASTQEGGATVMPQGAHVAPPKALRSKGVSQKKDAPKAKRGAKKANTKKMADPARVAKKPHAAGKVTAKARVIAMMQAKGAATLDEIMAVTGWQAHTTRGFISVLKNKDGLGIESSRREDGKRVYAIVS